MNNFLLNDALLWDYADGLLDPTAKQQVDAYLKQHPEWKARLEMVLAEKKALFGAHALEKPFPGFSDHVMAAWTTGQVEAFAASAKAKGRDWIVYGVVWNTLTESAAFYVRTEVNYTEEEDQSA